MMFLTLFFPSILCGAGVAAMSGPLGCFLVWRRMAYFGDTLAHSALLGVALALAFHLSMNVTVMLTCLSLAGILVIFEHKTQLANDTILGILASSCLAAGMVVVSFVTDVRVDIMSFLFGDILVVGKQDIELIFTTMVIVLGLLILFWHQLLAVTVDADLAQIEGESVGKLRLLLMLMIALVIAVAMKIVGILLITSLLIIPAASAKQLAKSPEQMAMVAGLLGLCAVSLGLYFSYLHDVPSGPAIVLTESLLFLLMSVIKQARDGLFK